MAYHVAATAAAAAAAEARRCMMEEEEQMTGFSDDDLQNDWEFKIVRANRNIFRNLAELQKLVNEEKWAGWILLEKSDNSRVRFKRTRSAQSNDAQIISRGFDPYRTHYGMPPGQYVALVMAITLAVVFGAAILITILILILVNMGFFN